MLCLCGPVSIRHVRVAQHVGRAQHVFAAVHHVGEVMQPAATRRYGRA